MSYFQYDVCAQRCNCVLACVLSYYSPQTLERLPNWGDSWQTTAVIFIICNARVIGRPSTALVDWARDSVVSSASRDQRFDPTRGDRGRSYNTKIHDWKHIQAEVNFSTMDVAPTENVYEGDVLRAKIITMVTLFGVSMTVGCLPMVISKKFSWFTQRSGSNMRSTNQLVVGLLSFGGGVLFATTFMHLLPEVDENIKLLQGRNICVYPKTFM